MKEWIAQDVHTPLASACSRAIFSRLDIMVESDVYNQVHDPMLEVRSVSRGVENAVLEEVDSLA